ncbi:legume lectin domain containing protein [Niveomyces insectorum RCEF 264]|uniref:Legume lectin domain containing protein n=1 Tax=Niveomyces insectorum RCEF 264 TaxID=1081102 RepID=A0A167Y7F6_9HYPO|nr:legume lectin domain containing protein [Niveomyces insectorum RCEF 264]
MAKATTLIAALVMLVRLTAGLASTDTITWGGDNTRTGYQTNHNMDPAIVGSSEFAQIFKTKLPGAYNGAAEQIFSQPLVYTPADGNQYVYFATTQNNVYKLDAKTGEILVSRNLGIPFLTADLNGCVDINPCVGVTSTGVIDPDTDTLYLTSKTYADQNGGTGPQGKPNGRYYLHALDVNNLTEQAHFPVDLEGIVARNNPARSFNGGIHHQRPGLLHSGQYIYAGFASHCVQYNFTGWLMGFDKTTGTVVEHFATEGEGVPNTTPGGGIWMSGGGLASDDRGSLFFGTGNGYASQLSTVPVEGHNPPTSLEEAAVHMTLNDDGSVTLVDFFMPQEKQALDGADKDLGTSPLELLPSEFACGNVSHMGVITGKSGKTYFLDLDDLGGYRTGPNSGDRVIQVYQNENSVYAGAGVYPLEGGYVYINVIQYPTHVFKFSCDDGVPSFTKVADSPENNAYILGVSHGTVTSLNGEPGTGLLWTTDVQGHNLRIYNAVPENGLLTEIQNFTVPGTTKFTRAVFGDGRVYMGTMLGYVYGFGAPVTEPLNCTSPTLFGTLDITSAAVSAFINCTAVVGTTITAVGLNSSNFALDSAPTLPLMLAAGDPFSFRASFKPSTVGFLSSNVLIKTKNAVAGYTAQTPVLLEGTGLSRGPLLSISPTSLTFTNVVIGANPGGVVQPVIFSNGGNSSLTITSVQFSQTSIHGPWTSAAASGNGSVVGAFQLSGLPSTLPGNGGKTVSVTFNPTTGGNYTLYALVQSNGGNQTFAIAGNAGTAPTCFVEFQTEDGLGWVPYQRNVSFSFGNVTENTARTLKLRITNNGGADAMPLSLTVSKPPFGVPGIISTDNQIDLAEGTVLRAGESATASMYCAVPKAQWNTDPYSGSATWTLNTNDPDWGKQYIQFACRAVAEQAPPLQANGLGLYRYVGCFKENNPGRQLQTELYGNDSNTNAMCIAACAAGNYEYCGTQYNRECWAGPAIPVQQVPEADCNYPCAGDIHQVCGGNGVGADAGGAFISLFAVAGASTNGSGTGPPHGPVVNPGNYGYASLGCFHEPASGRALANQLSPLAQTVDDCLAVAGAQNYKYAGVEYGGECWVGDSLSTGASQVNLTTCSMTCNGNGSEYCGGPLLLNVYKLNGSSAVLPPSSTPPTGPFVNPGVDGYTFLGCYNEPPGARAFSNQLSVTNATVAKCLASAAAAGYVYAGLEYGGECWSGNSINADASQAATSACSMTCNGNHTEYCGGSLLLDVYHLAVANSTNGTTTATGTGPTATGPATKAEVGNWVYQGCYTEATNGRALSAAALANANMSYAVCATYCADYAYFGVEYGSQCYCGNFFAAGSVRTTAAAAAAGGCTMPCAGDPTELCGGGSRLNVYAQQGMPTGPPAVSVSADLGGYVYAGCYAEPTAAGRALADRSTSNSTAMTEAYCARFCAGYTYFGVEYADQCFCGNQLSAGSARVDDAQCTFACAGRATELCGGSNLLNVFSLAPAASGSSASAASTSLSAPTTTATRTAASNSSAILSTFSVTPSTSSAAVTTSLSSTSSASSNPSSYVASSSLAVSSSPTAASNSSAGLSNTAVSPPASSVSASSSPSMSPSSSLSSSAPPPVSASTTSDSFSSVVSSTPSSVSSSSVVSSASASASATYDPSKLVTSYNNFTLDNCYAEPSSGHLLANLVSQNTTAMTVQTCLDQCGLYTYAGLEAGKQCWCGNTLNTTANGSGRAAAVVDETRCDAVCTGNATQYCGAVNLLLLYNTTAST